MKPTGLGGAAFIHSRFSFVSDRAYLYLRAMRARGRGIGVTHASRVTPRVNHYIIPALQPIVSCYPHATNGSSTRRRHLDRGAVASLSLRSTSAPTTVSAAHRSGVPTTRATTSLGPPPAAALLKANARLTTEPATAR